MELYLQASAMVLLAVILILLLGKQNRDLSLMVTMGVCCMVCAGAGVFLEPVIRFLGELRRLGELDPTLVGVMLKCAGIGLLSELIGLVCADAGEASVGKALQFLSNAVILFLSLPLLRQFVLILQEVLMKI